MKLLKRCSNAANALFLGPFVLLVASTAGCGPATKSDPEFWTPRAGGGSDGDGSEPDPVSTTTAGSSTSTGASGAGGGEPLPGGTLSFAFTTVSFDGEYAPRNIGAVWIADKQDAFVKTLEVWAAKRGKHLIKWRAASGNNVADAVTGATRSSHVAHQSVWNGTDAAGQAVPDGTYRVYVEFTESNSSDKGEPQGPWMAVDFEKGSDPQELSLPDQPAFTGIHLVYTP